MTPENAELERCECGGAGEGKCRQRFDATTRQGFWQTMIECDQPECGTRTEWYTDPAEAARAWNRMCGRKSEDA